MSKARIGVYVLLYPTFMDGVAGTCSLRLFYLYENLFSLHRYVEPRMTIDVILVHLFHVSNLLKNGILHSNMGRRP